MLTSLASKALAFAALFLPACGSDDPKTPVEDTVLLEDTMPVQDTATVEDTTPADDAEPLADTDDVGVGDVAEDVEQPDSAPEDVTSDATTEGSVAIIASEGGVVPLPDGLGTLIIPANALAADTTITVALETPESAANVGPVLVFGPSGTTFDPPATLELTLDKSGWQSDLESYGLEPTLVIKDGDDVEAVLQVASTDDTDNFLVKHFSSLAYRWAPTWIRYSDLAFPEACYELWETAPVGGTPPAGSGKALLGSCPQSRLWRTHPTAESAYWPPFNVYNYFQGVLEWVDVAGGTMTTINTDATHGTLNPSGPLTVKWQVHFKLSTSSYPNWCTSEGILTAINASLARTGGEAARLVYTNPSATCRAVESYVWTSTGYETNGYAACSCLVTFAPFSWPNEPIPYTVNGNTLDFFGETFGFSIEPELPRWWMDVPIIAALDVLDPVVENTSFAFYKMKLLIAK